MAKWRHPFFCWFREYLLLSHRSRFCRDRSAFRIRRRTFALIRTVAVEPIAYLRCFLAYSAINRKTIECQLNEEKLIRIHKHSYLPPCPYLTKQCAAEQIFVWMERYCSDRLESLQSTSDLDHDRVVIEMIWINWFIYTGRKVYKMTVWFKWVAGEAIWWQNISPDFQQSFQLAVGSWDIVDSPCR